MDGSFHIVKHMDDSLNLFILLLCTLHIPTIHMNFDALQILSIN